MKENCKKLKGNFMNYEFVKFEKYEAYMDGKKIIAHPIKTDNIKLINDFSSIDLLLSLCNLYNKYNSNLYNNKLEEGDSIEFGIINWCNEFVHPNNQVGLRLHLDLYNDKDSNRYKDKSLIDDIYKMSKFDIDIFKSKLIKLASVFNSWFAIEMAIKEKDTRYLNRASEMGKMYVGGILPSSLYEKNLTDKHKIKYLKDNYLNIIGGNTSEFPKLNIGLKYDKSRNVFDFGIDGDNIFEIAWSTFITLVRDSFNNKLYKHKIMVCENCGDYIVRSSSTMKYCSKTECQAVRNRLKVKVYNKKNKKK